MKKGIITFLCMAVIGMGSVAVPTYAMDTEIQMTQESETDVISETDEIITTVLETEMTVVTVSETVTETENEIVPEPVIETEDETITETTLEIVIETLEETEETEGESESTEESEDVVETVDMYRLYNPNSGEHCYTGTLVERNHLISVGWNYEGIGWKAPVTGETVYRLYNPNVGDHHYTLNASERDHLVSVGWNYEGIGWYSDSEKSVPIYRLYNPNAVTGTHHYTATYAEAQYLESIGWNYEGIGWYSSEGASEDSVNPPEVPEEDEKTIGEQKVDMYVAQILKEVNNKLYGSYKWCVNNITYKKLPIPMIPPEGYTEDEYYAVYAYENRQGNCYCYAAAFYQLALELGYDAEFIQGKVGMAAGGTGPHGWVEIQVNGGTYVCDPDAEYETGRNAYMVTYSSAPFKYYK